jgi:hypothetical protein
MIGTTQTSAFEFPRTVQGGRDVSWYGTLGVLAASIGVLVAAFFGG